MIVEADEVRDRIAAQVATLYGYGAGDDPFDPGMSPANVAARVFAVTVELTEANGTRQPSVGPCEVVSRVVVKVEAPVGLAGPERDAALRTEMQAEPALRRRLLARGETWTYGLRITWRSTRRTMREDAENEWLQTDHAFDVLHQVEL